MFDGERGWEILYCEYCGYAIDKSGPAINWKLCPLCVVKGRGEHKLVDRYVVHRPENKILKPHAKVGT